MQYEVPDTEPENYEADNDYVPGEYDENSDDGDDDRDRGGVNDIDPPQDPDDIDANYDDNASIIINPSGPYHDGPISGVTTYQDQTIVDTDTAVETADTEPTGMAEPTGGAEPIGVEKPPPRK